MTEKKPDLSLVIPVYNEENNLERLFLKLHKVVLGRKLNYEIIFIDDGSSDTSFSVLEKIYSKHKKYVRLVKFRRNFGKGAALLAGFRYAKGELLVTLDSDLQDDPNEIPKLLKKLNEGYDVVSGWKVKRNDPFIKKISCNVNFCLYISSF